ncbi:hypothetical protein A2707_01135 [Candidatus Saccharibacteria bacterium RIFCSPHIGHO2_01_FULL_45_15]|nr:MAG: hypothetical protein A2707_01135 [Candidatus Saccharibacteria bacterium RIFCSPHIGHO2_01_FULL_45_15]OGL26974.1 MAG: hypothetical protein A3C39_02250 [Candidatus Saccharibacteria bacterium RIFCSPHIGHO2_02_FULL_46_12]OGL32923.1 MAG: hypothetical protein A3E76_06190 [Candidatus Saccharibacteria bacterium RIFCSPHIGHO2_12_FULL_44_22]
MATQAVRTLGSPEEIYRLFYPFVKQYGGVAPPFSNATWRRMISKIGKSVLHRVDSEALYALITLPPESEEWQAARESVRFYIERAHAAFEIQVHIYALRKGIAMITEDVRKEAMEALHQFGS